MKERGDEAAYRAGTPRTEAEARAMLAEVEPMRARAERTLSLRARARKRVRLRVRVRAPGGRVPERFAVRERAILDWQPRATRAHRLLARSGGVEADSERAGHDGSMYLL